MTAVEPENRNISRKGAKAQSYEKTECLIV